jgi:hypothetical protein
MTDTDQFAHAAQEQWSLLVTHALLTKEDRLERLYEELAKSSKSSKQAIKRKIQAVRWAGINGLDREKIIEQGQSAILSSYAKAKKEEHGPQRVLSWRVSKSLADAIMSSETSIDQDEALVTRLVRVLTIGTSEEFWSFIHATFADLSDDDLKNIGGMFTEKDAPRKRRK